jgi:hypothetical protein
MRHELEHDNGNDYEDNMTNVINHSTKQAKQFLHRTKDPANPYNHRAIVCNICEHFIIGTETIHKLSKDDICAHKKRLGVKSYEMYYQVKLKPEVKKQYQVQGLQDMLLSLRSRKFTNGYATCMLHWNAATDGIEKNSSQMCHCKWLCDRIFSTTDKVRQQRR